MTRASLSDMIDSYSDLVDERKRCFDRLVEVETESGMGFANEHIGEWLRDGYQTVQARIALVEPLMDSVFMEMVKS